MTTHWQSEEQARAHFGTLLASRENLFPAPPRNDSNADACAHNLGNLNVDFAAVSAGVNGLGGMEISSDLSKFWIERAFWVLLGYRSVPVANLSLARQR